MTRMLDGAVQAARRRSAPWDAERAARVAQRIDARRARSGGSSTGLARLALGGLASVALCASLARLSPVLQLAPPPERSWASAPSPVDGPEAEVEAPFVERPVGDGGDAMSDE